MPIIVHRALGDMVNACSCLPNHVDVVKIEEEMLLHLARTMLIDVLRRRMCLPFLDFVLLLEDSLNGPFATPSGRGRLKSLRDLSAYGNDNILACATSCCVKLFLTLVFGGGQDCQVFPFRDEQVT